MVITQCRNKGVPVLSHIPFLFSYRFFGGGRASFMVENDVHVFYLHLDSVV